MRNGEQECGACAHPSLWLVVNHAVDRRCVAYDHFAAVIMNVNVNVNVRGVRVGRMNWLRQTFSCFFSSPLIHTWTNPSRNTSNMFDIRVFANRYCIDIIMTAIYFLLHGDTARCCGGFAVSFFFCCNWIPRNFWPELVLHAFWTMASFFPFLSSSP